MPNPTVRMMPVRWLLALFLMTSFALAACDLNANGENPLPSPTTDDSPAATDVSDISPLDSNGDGILVLGDVSDSPTKKIRRFQPLANYLAERLGEYGITEGQVRIAPDLNTMATWLENGELDIYFDSLYPAMIVSDQSGAEPVLRRWKDGDAHYHTIIFTHADSDITRLDQLPGNLIAYDEPISTSGYMLPTAYLTEAGYTVVEKNGVNAAVDADEIGYVFSDDDENSIQWVVSRRVMAAAVDSSSFSEIPEHSRENLVILAETEEVARQVTVFAPNLDDDLADTIVDILLTMHDTEDGQRVLRVFDTSRFDTFPEGADDAVQRMRELYQLLPAN